jgi:hypothetical protein
MRPAVTFGLGIGFGLVMAAAAHADGHADGRVAVLDGPPGTTPTIAEQQAPLVDSLQPVAQPAPLAAIATSDAMSDRAFGRSTAINLRPAQFDFSMRTAVEHGSMLSIAAGITDGLELSADAGYARHLGDDYGVGFKVSLLRRATYALAIDASVHSTSEESVRSTLLSADFKVTTCALDCNMLFTAGLGFLTAPGENSNTMPTLELSMLFGTGVVRPMIEALEIDGDAGASFAFGGLRIGGKHLGVDLGAGVLDLSYRDAAVGMVVGVGVRP